MKRVASFFFALAIISTTKLFGQVLPEVQADFNNYAAANLQEKVFVHTDKNGYTAGELLWFKVYNVDGIFMKPLGLSKVVYVEVLDNKQTPVLQTKIAMKDGNGNGSFYIPANLPTGNFELRAYTSWMKNFGADYYFSKKLVIINPMKGPGKTEAAPLAGYDIQFFPEGGHLVNGMESVVGVKVTDQWGKGINFKGAIVNQHSDTVARFEPLKFGIGRFVFKPQINSSYRALIKIEGKVIQKDIPAISDKGYVMSLKDNGNDRLLVSVSTNLPDGNVYLFAQSHQVVKAVQSSVVTNGAANFIVDKSRLGEGISQITVFSADRKPVCERLYFKRPAKKLSISAGVSAAQYTTRKKAEVNVATQSIGNKSVAASLSVAVYRMDSLQHNQQEDILSYLWLKSDLKGNIESSGYYFNDQNTVAAEAADNLMLTQGWRNFAWDDVLNKKAPAFNFLPELNGPVITATLVNKLNNQPEKDIQAYLGILGKHIQLYPAKSDARGKLVFNMKEFYGPTEIVAETNTTVDTNYRIDVLTPFSDHFAKTTMPQFEVTPALKTTFDEAALTVQVQNIYNGLKMRQFIDSRPDTTAFYGTPYKTYLLDNYTRFTTMEEVMREYIREVNVFHTNNRFRVKVVSGMGFLADEEPMMLIDGVPFFDMNKVFKVDPLKIRKLEDVPFNYSLGSSYEHGIFSFTSYKGDLGGAEIDPHAVVLDYEGLQQERQFYSPLYETEAQAASHMPDFRNVLYWSPSLNTGADGKQQFSFYTSDQPGTYIGVVQGITSTGEAGSQTFSFEVR